MEAILATLNKRRAALLVLLLCLLVGIAQAHEPIFGLGPRTIWKGGFGFETEIEREREQLQSGWVLKHELLYGITADVAVTFELPYVLARGNPDGKVQRGFGDALVRGKWRFFRHEVWGGIYHAALLAGIELPTAERAVSSGDQYDYFLGMAGAYEGRRWLVFGDVRYRWNTGRVARKNRPDVVLYDVAVGIRPVKTEYEKPDTVIMFELNGEVFRVGELGSPLPGGLPGHRRYAAVGVWFTYRNWAIKPGFQVPVNQPGGPNHGMSDYRAVFAVEFHH